MSIVQQSDFVGEYGLSKNNFSNFNGYIKTYEEFYLVRLMGAELYALFIADLTAGTPQTPQTQRFIDIFEPFNIDDNNCLHVSEGIKQMLIEFIYFHIVRDSSNFKTNVGVKAIEGEMSRPTPYSGYNITESYNKAVDTYCEIQWYICDNDEDYPEENIQPIDYISGV